MALPPPASRPLTAPAPQAGFTYIAILLAVAIFGVGLASAGVVWHTAAKRDREVELLFVGNEFRDAIRAYTSLGAGLYPRELSDLIEDRRFPGIKRHLRKIYVDPMTARAEWGLVRGPDGGIIGVHSLSGDKPIKVANFEYADRDFEGKTRYSEWKFVYQRTAPIGTTAPATTIRR